jgi:hypothetical protein
MRKELMIAPLSTVHLEEARAAVLSPRRAMQERYRQYMRGLTPDTAGQLELGPEDRCITERARLKAAAKAEGIYPQIQRRGTTTGSGRPTSHRSHVGDGLPRAGGPAVNKTGHCVDYQSIIRERRGRQPRGCPRQAGVGAPRSPVHAAVAHTVACRVRTQKLAVAAMPVGQ